MDGAPTHGLPRGATWHARWVLPLVMLVGLVAMPWNDRPAPVMDPAQALKALAQWQAWTAKRLEMAHDEQAKKMPPAPSDGSVQVRIIPASAPR